MNKNLLILQIYIGSEALASQNIITCQDIKTYGETKVSLPSGVMDFGEAEASLPRTWLDN